MIPILAKQLTVSIHHRATVDAEVEALEETHPLSEVLTPMPGIGARTAARIFTEVVGKYVADAGHLVSYAGVAPGMRRSGTSVRGEHATKGGDERLKRPLLLSAFSLGPQLSRAYYDRKRGQGKRHNRAIIALARRADVPFAMLRDDTLYQDPDAPQNSSPAALAA